MARIAYAENAQDALADFGREFDPYFSIGAQVLEGVQQNAVTRALFAEAALERVRQIEGRASLELAACFHFNFS